jgi:hypothetical protein
VRVVPNEQLNSVKTKRRRARSEIGLHLLTTRFGAWTQQIPVQLLGRVCKIEKRRTNWEATGQQEGEYNEIESVGTAVEAAKKINSIRPVSRA